ncbi:MAG: DUF2723 domain-containing protein, partial [Anaerolineae bacterium]|nr:DUF2723 domain-containing protein [Anaerolineae bacterium]
LLLGYLVEKLPLWPLALRFNLFSALTMAGAAGFVAATAFHLMPSSEKPADFLNILIAIASGLTLAFASLVWSQAVITEVYGLFMLLAAATLWALLTQKPTWLIGFLLGLTITAHLTGWLLLPLVLVLTPKPKLITLAAALFLGLLPFALLPLLATPTSPVIWGDLDSFQGWWWLVSSHIYRGYSFALPPDLWLSRLSTWGLPMLTQFTWAGLPLIVAAFLLVPTENRRLYGLLLATAVLYLIVPFFYHTDDAIIFTLPAWLLLSLLLVPAYQRLGWLALLLPLALLLLNFQANNLKQEYQIRTHAESLLAAVPENAIVETAGDPTIFTLWYIIYAEAQRADTIPVDSDLFAFDWYRQRLHLLNPDLEGLEQDDLAQFRELNGAKRPYCFASLAQTNPDTPENFSLTCTEN